MGQEGTPSCDHSGAIRPSWWTAGPASPVDIEDTGQEVVRTLALESTGLGAHRPWPCPCCVTVAVLLAFSEPASS